jgi:2-succinyl-5-enolpyruvyl-6-hydroxy-3-cyclohexene-1-carboxylate synthase
MIDGPGSLPEVDEYFVTRQKLTAKNLSDEFGLTYRRITNGDDVTAVLDEFFKPGDRAKILEFESGSTQAKELFLRFKEKVRDKIKNSYAA